MNFLFLASTDESFIDWIGRFFEAFRLFWEGFGEYGLFIYSVIETITPISGVEFFFVTLINVAGKPWWRVGLNATLANVVGAFIIYYFMAKEDNKFYNKVLKKEHQVRAQKLFTRYGVWAIFIFAMTPLPFFVIIFTAALARMKFKPFILAVFISRGTRFLLTSYIFYRFKEVSPLMLVLILFIIAIPLALIIMFIQTKILEFFEKRAGDSIGQENA